MLKDTAVFVVGVPGSGLKGVGLHEELEKHGISVGLARSEKVLVKQCGRCVV